LKADDKYIVPIKKGLLTGNKTAGAGKQKKVYNFYHFKARKDIDDMNMRFYTNEQVHQIVDQLLLQFDEAAPGPEPAYLKNDIPQQSSPENKVTLTVSEAAEMIGISKPSMYEVVRAGKVRSVKVGKKILISRQSLMDWVKKGETYGAEAC
jgi:excisionase family DNA binding protein